MKRIYKTISLLLLCCTWLQGYSQQVSFSVQAHQDDWSLFWVQSIANEINAGNKTVFITLTAGDAGNGAGGFCSPLPYFLTREKGAIHSTKYAVDLTGATPIVFPDSVRAVVNGHSVVKYTYKNTVNYFLRLADGGIPGAGNPITGNVSLQKLKRNQITSLVAVDGTAIYNGWSDVINTIKAIVTTERGNATTGILHTASLDTIGANRGDHSDHIHTSIAAQAAVNDLAWVGIYEYVDYNSPSYPPNLTLQQHAAATAIFAVNSWGLLEGKYAAPFDEGHKSWLPVDVLFIKRAPVGGTPSGNRAAPVNNSPQANTANATQSGVMLLSDYKKN